MFYLVIYMKILIVDDDSKIREIVKEYGKLDNHTVLEASSGKEAFDIIDKEKVELVILDIMLPDYTGYEIANKIKDIPILMLSAKSEEFDKLKGFEVGAIDYITKPFSPKELMARIKVISHKKNKDIYTLDGIKLDRSSKKLFIDDKEIKITLKEYELLDYFIKNKDILLTRDAILNNVWNIDFYGTDRTVDTHVKMLRKHLGKYGKHIVTVRGGGYRFE